MPGFRVGFETGDVNRSLPATTKFYYNYTWEIPEILGTVSNRFNQLIALRDMTTPAFTANKETFISTSVEYKYAKSITWEDVKITFYDTEGLINIIKSWRSSVWKETHGLMSASGYKKNTNIRCFLPDDTKGYGWKLIGSWPSSIRSGDLTYTSSDVKVVEVNLTYDYADELESN